jgi:hypothetical protein
VKGIEGAEEHHVRFDRGLVEIRHILLKPLERFQDAGIAQLATFEDRVLVNSFHGAYISRATIRHSDTRLLLHRYYTITGSLTSQEK